MTTKKTPTRRKEPAWQRNRARVRREALEDLGGVYIRPKKKATTARKRR